MPYSARYGYVQLERGEGVSEDEVVLVLLASDSLAVKAFQYYGGLCRAEDVHPEYMNEVAYELDQFMKRAEIKKPTKPGKPEEAPPSEDVTTPPGWSPPAPPNA